MLTHRLTPHDERAIATAAFCDPRSVRKALAGSTVAPLTLARIRSALVSLGRTDLLSALAPVAPGPTPPQAA